MPRVLIVDDEKNVLTTLSIALRRHEFTVREAQSGSEALKILEEHPCDILLSDVCMHPMDGYKLASQVREKYPGTGIVLMSAYGFRDESNDRDVILDCPQLIKPFSVADLIKVLLEEEKRGITEDRKITASRNKRRILAFGKKDMVSQLHEIIESAGFSIECLSTIDDLLEGIKKVPCDLFLIDGDFLDGRKWKILNAIDQQEPGKPVILLVSKNGDRDYFSSPDLALTVLDRNTFFLNRSWAVESLKRSMIGTESTGMSSKNS